MSADQNAPKAIRQNMDYLSKLENQSIYIFREAFHKFENLAMLWSIGKDSTVLLWLARKAFFGHVPFPLVHVDTSYKIPSMIEYRDFLGQTLARMSDIKQTHTYVVMQEVKVESSLPLGA